MDDRQEYLLIVSLKSNLENALDDLHKLGYMGTLAQGHERELKDMLDFYEQTLEEEWTDDEEEESPSLAPFSCKMVLLSGRH